jgi:hypothetical protein
MSIESIPLGCRGCPNILPYITDVQRLENRVVTPQIREKLLTWGFSEQEIDQTDAEVQFELPHSRAALADAAKRTVGCAGLLLINLDPESQSSEGIEALCMSRVDIEH